MVYEKTVFVKRKKPPIVSGEVDKIDVRELYDGRENPLNIDFEKRIKFTCSFDNIQNYPFGMQVNPIPSTKKTNLLNVLMRIAAYY